MVEPPSGTVTLMFTDVEGSTQLVQRLGEEYAATLNDVRRLLREAVGGEGGYEVDCRADELFAAFQRPKDALAAAVSIQRSFATFAWPKGARVRLRIGLHTGEPVVEGGAYLGLDVSRAARICSAGHGGQILVSASTHDLVANAGRVQGPGDLHPSRACRARNGSSNSSRPVFASSFPPLRSGERRARPAEEDPAECPAAVHPRSRRKPGGRGHWSRRSNAHARSR